VAAILGPIGNGSRLAEAARGAPRARGARGNPEAARLVYRWLLGYGLVVTLQLVAVWDMVFKQGS